ncbi:unnamed protein product [Calicophoron daubneyi]|uniref:Uncharacterized protein n=1 Tax=Calicophoron daubneyi TaxID=300641 RepID=A0AAV2TLC8_CALDB
MSRENRLLERIRNSKCPLSTVKDLKSSGHSLENLNQHAEVGTLLCEIVGRNYGLGVKILLDSGLDMSAQNTRTGDTPLILVCAEGLCGPAIQLINRLPPDKLMHSNKSGATALKHLLTRGHGACGCIATLLSVLPLSRCMLPRDIEQIYEKIEQVQLRSLSKSKSVMDCNPSESDCLAFGEDCSLTPAPIEPNSHKALLTTVGTLTDQVLSSDLYRILSVIQTWIQGNLLIIRVPHRARHQEENLVCIQKRLIDPILRRIEMGHDMRKEIHTLIEYLIRLVVLEQLDARTVWRRLADSSSSIEDGISDQGLSFMMEMAGEEMGFPVSLQFLAIRELRRIMQVRFIRMCLHANRKSDAQTPIIQNAFIFPRWVEQIPVPKFMRRIILLEPTNCKL